MSEQPEFGSGNYGGSGGGQLPPRGGGQVPFDDDDDDFTGAAEHATRSAGGSDGDIFSTVIGSFLGKKNQLATEDIDEQAAVNSHQKLYGGNDDGGGEHDSSSMGNAAALQALKMFTGSSGGSTKSEFIGLAMAEASKLFEQQQTAGKVSSDTSKESAVQQAGEMALKMYLKSKTGAGGGGEGGGSGGGSSGLLSLASKFM